MGRLHPVFCLIDNVVSTILTSYFMQKRDAKVEKERHTTIADLQQQLSTTKHKLSDALSQKSNTEKIFQEKLSKQQNSARKAEKHYSTLIESLEADLAANIDLQKENTVSLNNKMREMEEKYAETIRTYEGHLRSADSEIEDWTNNVQPTYERRLQSVTEEKRALALQLTREQKEMVGLKSELEKGKEQLQDALQNIEQMTIESDEMCHDINGVVDGYKKDIARLTASNDDQRFRMEHLNKEKEYLEENCTELRQNVKEMEHKLLEETRAHNKDKDSSAEEIEKAQKEAARLIDCNREQQYKLEDLKSENQHYKENCTELQQNAEQLEQRLAQEQRARDECKALAEKDNHEIQKEVSRLTRDNDEQQYELENLKRENKRYEESCAEMRQSVKELEHQLANKTRVHNEYRELTEEENCKLKKEISWSEHLEKESNANRMELRLSAKELENRLAEEMRTSKECKEKAEEETRKAQKEVSRLTNCNDVHQYKLDDLNKENEQCEENCKTLRWNVKELKNKLSEATRTNEEYKERAEKEDYEALNAENRYLAEKLAQSETQHTTQLSMQRAKITQLEAEKLQLNTQIAQYPEKQRDKDSELLRTLQTNKMLKSKERYLESRVESLANQISMMVQDYEMKISSSLSLSASGSVELGMSGSSENSNIPAEKGLRNGRSLGG